MANGNALEHSVVSSEAERLILVDDRDREIGHASKAHCHDGDGILHRAFSLFLFNRAGELLIQQRSDQKRLWPKYWSNTCCSHPRAGESMDVALERRLKQELGMHTRPRFLYKFQYHARYGNAGSENELCSVFAGQAGGQVRANCNEISAWRYIAANALTAEIASAPEIFTPWFKLEWARLQKEHAGELNALRFIKSSK